MKPRPQRHDRRSYNQSQGGNWGPAGSTQDHNGGPPDTRQSHNENQSNRNSTVRKTAKPKVFTPTDIEYSVIKALVPVLRLRDGTVYSFADWTMSGDGVVIVLPNGQEFWLTIEEAK